MVFTLCPVEEFQDHWSCSCTVADFCFSKCIDCSISFLCVVKSFYSPRCYWKVIFVSKSLKLDVLPCQIFVVNSNCWIWFNWHNDSHIKMIWCDVFGEYSIVFGVCPGCSVIIYCVERHLGIVSKYEVCGSWRISLRKQKSCLLEG